MTDDAATKTPWQERIDHDLDHVDTRTLGERVDELVTVVQRLADAVEYLSLKVERMESTSHG